MHIFRASALHGIVCHGQGAHLYPAYKASFACFDLFHGQCMSPPLKCWPDGEADWVWCVQTTNLLLQCGQEAQACLPGRERGKHVEALEPLRRAHT